MSLYGAEYGQSLKCDWALVTAPLQEPVTLVHAKLHCRALADATDEDGLVALRYIAAARQYAEEKTRRALFTQTWRLIQDDFTREMWLPRAAPLQSATVTYYDAAGAQQTLSSSYYRVDTISEPGRVVLNPGLSWPAVQCNRGQAVEITYVCGWSTVADIPEPIKLAVLMLIDHYYENRSAVQVGIGIGAVEIPKSVDALLDPFCVYWRPPSECW